MTTGIAEVPVWEPDLGGWVIIVKYGKLLLVFLIVVVLCLALYLPKSENPDENLESKVIPEVTVTADEGFLSVTPQFLDNGELQVTSTSSMPVNVVIETKEGNQLLSVIGLLPGDSFSYTPLEPLPPCTVTASSSN
jgi:hypothetical protein